MLRVRDGDDLVMASLASLPPGVACVAEALATSAGVVAVVLGGSRTTTSADVHSDWDLVAYYRGALDLQPLAAFGEVHPPGSWGRLMNGGAWLTLDDLAIDVLLRDLDVVQHWTAAAEQGVYELDAILGYMAGLPTYSLMAELASGQLLAGTLPSVGAMPLALVAGAPPRWRFARDFSLEYARMHAARGNVVGAVGHAAKAAFEEAHARLCARGEWVLNEKRMLSAAGLDSLASLFASPPKDSREFDMWLQAVASALA